MTPACAGKQRRMLSPKWARNAEVTCARCPLTGTCDVSGPGMSGPGGWQPSITDDHLEAAVSAFMLRTRAGSTTITFSGLYQRIGNPPDLIVGFGFPLPKSGKCSKSWVWERSDVHRWACEVLDAAGTEHAELIS